MFKGHIDLTIVVPLLIGCFTLVALYGTWLKEKKPREDEKECKQLRDELEELKKDHAAVKGRFNRFIKKQKEKSI